MFSSYDLDWQSCPLLPPSTKPRPLRTSSILTSKRKPLPHPFAMVRSSYCTCPVLPVRNGEAPPPLNAGSLSSFVIMLKCQNTLTFNINPLTASSCHTPSLTSALARLSGTVGSGKEIHTEEEENRRVTGEESNPQDFRD